MTVIISEVEENGIPYRITEDQDTGLYIKESIQAGPPSEPDRITQLENESAMLALELVDTQIRLDDTERRLEQSEAEQAALLLALVEAEVI